MMEAKHIVLRTGSFPAVSETFVRQQAELIIQSGHDLHVLAERKVDPTSEAALGSGMELLLSRTRELGRLDFVGGKDRLLCFLKSIKEYGWKKAKRMLDAYRYLHAGRWGTVALWMDALKGLDKADLYHIQFGSFKHPLVRLKEFGFIQAPIICTFHGYDAHFTEADKAERMAEYAPLFAVASFITANSPYLAAKLEALGCPSEKLRIIPMSVDTGFFLPSAQKGKREKKRLMSIGRLIPLKGFHLGIKVVEGLINMGHVCEYHIIGEGGERQHLEQMIAERSLEEHVILRGALPPEDIRKELQGSDIYLMCSTVDEHGRREAQGLVTSEAQACGVPVVAFESGGVAYSIEEGKTGLLVAEDDVKAMAEAAAGLLKDEGRRQQMADEARRFVERAFSTLQSKSRWNELYEEAMKEG